ncbi:MAG: glycerol kinase GlpK [bacterium]
MILSIDQGTTGTTALLIDPAGRPIDRAYREIRQYYPQPGQVEHDPEDIWDSVCATCGDLLSRNTDKPKAIGLANQRETIIVWDASTGRPVAPAIVWQDRRTADICRRMREEGLEPEIRERSGLLLDPYFSGTKIAWLLDSDPQLRRRAERGELRAGTVDSWLIWKMTDGAVHATDRTNASRTLLLNLRTLDWDEASLGHFSIPRELLPTIIPSSGVAAETVEVGPFPEGIPLAGIAGDQQAALYGQGCFGAGNAKNTYGTGCFYLRHTGSSCAISEHPILTTVAASSGKQAMYAFEGSVFVAGAAIQWLRDSAGFIKESEDCEQIALEVPDTAGVFFVPAFVGLGAPYWDPDARGAIVGLTRGATWKHIVRAALESITFQVCDLLGVEELGEGLDELRVDGGACRNDFLMQFQADLLGVPVNRPEQIETTALGAAFLAGLAVGEWSSEDDLQNVRSSERIFEPSKAAENRQDLLHGWKEAVARVLTSKSR